MLSLLFAALVASADPEAPPPAPLEVAAPAATTAASTPAAPPVEAAAPSTPAAAPAPVVDAAPAPPVVSLHGATPESAVGGAPIPFDYAVDDPAGAVTSVRVHYRRAGETEFSMMQLRSDGAGHWRGALAAEFTSSKSGFVLELYASAAAGTVVVATVASAAAPTRVAIAPGVASLRAPPPLPPAVVWIGAGVTGVFFAGAIVAGIANVEQQQAFAAEAAAAEHTPISGSVLRTEQENANTSAFAAWSLAGAGVVVGVVTAVAALGFTDWSTQ